MLLSFLHSVHLKSSQRTKYNWTALSLLSSSFWVFLGMIWNQKITPLLIRQIYTNTIFKWLHFKYWYSLTFWNTDPSFIGLCFHIITYRKNLFYFNHIDKSKHLNQKQDNTCHFNAYNEETLHISHSHKSHERWCNYSNAVGDQWYEKC